MIDYTDKPFLSIRDTCKATGLSIYYIRGGIRDGSIPFITCGNKFLVNVPLLMKRLNQESEVSNGKTI